MQKVLIVHFRVGKTDGVSLEIDNWKQVLAGVGYDVKLCSGPENIGADYVVSNLEHQLNPEVTKIQEQLYGVTEDYNESDFAKKFQTLADSVAQDFEKVIKEFNPDRIIISNIFSVGENIAAPCGMLRVLDSYKIPTVLVHHDFYWEPVRYKECKNKFSNKLVEENLIPIRNYIKHAVINSIAQNELFSRKNIVATILYDSIDFSHNICKEDNFNRDILAGWHIKKTDIAILQATRVVRRKNIEISMDLVRSLQDLFYKNKDSHIDLYNNKTFYRDKSKIYLVLSGYPEARDIGYFKDLLYYAALRKINICYIGDSVGINRNGGTNIYYFGKRYSIWDAYSACDVITYPSAYEGFGNQLLEAILAKKPTAVFEYPVYLSDIKDKGFDFVSLGSEISYDKNTGLAKVPEKTLKQAAQRLYDCLTSRRTYSNMVNKNYILGSKNFSFDVAKEVLVELLS